MALWLAFDAASPLTGAALARGGELLAKSSGESRSGPSLLAHIEATFRRAAVQPADLDGIVALGGPGSFTGIRVSLATALALHGGLEAPVCSLSNLAALALAALAAADEGERAGPIVALVDALRGEWFAQEFRPEHDRLAATADPRRAAAADLAPAARAVLAVHGAQALPTHLAARPVHRASALAPAVAVAASLERIGALLSTDLAPIYLRGFTPRGSAGGGS